MKAQHLIHSVMQASDRYRRNTCIPNYTPTGWWECDIFEITPAGSFREYEVKMTVADFRRDGDKEKPKPKSGRWEQVDGKSKYLEDFEKKHDLLAKGDARGPTQFWYVVPEGLLMAEELPPWAGLIECSRRGNGWPEWNMIAVEKRAAPRLHSAKVAQSTRDAAIGCCYWRFHGMLQIAHRPDENIWHDMARVNELPLPVEKSSSL